MIQKVTKEDVVELLTERLRFISLMDEEDFDPEEAVALSEILDFYSQEEEEMIDVQKSFARFVEKYGLQDIFPEGLGTS